MEKLCNVFLNGKPLVYNVSTDVARILSRAYPDGITCAEVEPVDVPLFRYDVCFSTPCMNNASAHDLLERTVNHQYFTGYTVYDGHGSWNGAAEPSYTFTVTQEEDDTAIHELARAIKVAFRQESILVIKTPVIAWLI